MYTEGVRVLLLLSREEKCMHRVKIAVAIYKIACVACVHMCVWVCVACCLKERIRSTNMKSINEIAIIACIYDVCWPQQLRGFTACTNFLLSMMNRPSPWIKRKLSRATVYCDLGICITRVWPSSPLAPHTQGKLRGPCSLTFFLLYTSWTSREAFDMFPLDTQARVFDFLSCV